jgi:copper chaperone CopZ
MKMKIEGMTCGHCVSSVKTALENVPGVTSAQVDLEAGEATVQGDVGADLLIAAARDQGFEARAN